MANEDGSRTLSLRIEGDAVRDHSVSIKLFAKTISAAQSLLFHLAEAKVDKQPTLRGRKSAAIAAECELFLKPIRANCVSVEMHLPQREETLFPDYPDFSEGVLADARETLLSYSLGEFDHIARLCPNPIHRRRVLKDLVSVTPSPGSDYSLVLRAEGQERRLQRPSRDTLKVIMAETERELPRVPDETQFVEAKGMAVVRGTEIVEWKETYDILELDLDTAWRPRQIDWEDCHLRLRHPIAVTLEEREPDLWVAEHDQLGIIATGPTEDEARESFAQEFVVLWHEIAQEPAERLTPDAVTLKRILVDLVDQPVML